MNAHIFPGQGSQHPGMGRNLFEQFDRARELFHRADEVLDYPISEVMFHGSEEQLKQTKHTQIAMFLHGYIAHACLHREKPDMTAGHSLGEYTALAASGCLRFEDALQLVEARANAMQKCCEKTPSTMAAVLKLDDKTVEDICASIEGEVVVPANYNCPGQLVISGTNEGVARACEKVKEVKGKALPLAVGGAFHSPLMEPARVELAEAIEHTEFHTPVCPVYQNVDALPHTDPADIKKNLLMQLTSPVRWTYTVQHMMADGADEFIEVGPGTALQGMVKRVNPEANAHSAE